MQMAKKGAPFLAIVVFGFGSGYLRRAIIAMFASCHDSMVPTS